MQSFPMTPRLTAMTVCATALAAAALVAQQAPPVTAIRAARLFDGKADTAISDAVVLVENGRITAVGSKIAVPANARVVDLGYATILPGFIDAHVHLTDESSDDWNTDLVSSQRRTVPEQTLRAAEFARRTLM